MPFFQGLTGGREISHVLAFIFTFLLKNFTVDEIPKACCTQRRYEKSFQDKKIEKERKKSDSNAAKHTDQHNAACDIISNSLEEESHNHFCFRYEPSVSPCLDDIFAPIIHPAHTRNNPTVRGSTLSISQMWIQTSSSKSSSLSSCQSGKKLGKKRRKRYSSCIPLVQSDSEGEENIKTSRLGRAIVKFTMNPNDFDYFTRAVYSDEDKCHETETDQTSGPPTEKVCIDDSSLCLSLVELLQCIVSIQTQLAMHEAELKHLSSPLLATHDILQFSLDTFSSMVSELKYLEQKRDEAVDMQVLLMGMLKLVFSSTQRFLKSSELLVTLTELCVVPKLLNLASLLLDVRIGPENVLADNDHEISGAAKINAEKSHLDIIKACLAHEIIVGLLLLLQSCTSIKVEWKDVWQCLHLHKIFLQNHGSEVIKKVVFLKSLLSLSKRSEVLNYLSQLVLYMKYWREDIYHIEKCDKKSHRFCEYQAIRNHHSQALGTSSQIVSAVDPGACMISNFACIVLDCFAASSEPDIHACSIKALSKCGLCCCMSTRMILSKLLQGLLCRQPHIVSYITLFIENIVWHDLSGLILTDPVRCAFCQIPEHLGTGVNHLSAESTTDESFNFVSKGKETFHQFKNYLKEDQTQSNSNYLSHWEGIALYRKFIFHTCISSKIIGHIIRLVSQSNTGVRLEICEHLIVPALKEIYDQGITNYLASTGHEKDVLVGLIKSFRLTLAESSDKTLLRFLQGYGSGLLSACKEIPGIRHEAFALLCNIVKKELKTKPGLPVMSDTDEENNLIFTKAFEWEIIEHNEFWSVYFGMKAEEVRQRFFIHTRINVDGNMQDHKESINQQSVKNQVDTKSGQENRKSNERFRTLKGPEVEESEVVGEDADYIQAEGNNTTKATEITALPQSLTNELTLIDITKTNEVDRFFTQSSPSKSTDVEHIKEDEDDTRESLVTTGYPQDENGSMKSHMTVGSPHPSTSKSTSIDSVKEAASDTKKTIAGSPQPSTSKSSTNESEEEDIKVYEIVKILKSEVCRYC